MSNHITSTYPWTRQPLITNAPMGAIAGPALATAVTRAHGLAFLGAGYDVSTASSNLQEARRQIATLNDPNLPRDGTLPVGLGVLCFAIPLPDIVRLVTEHKPVAVWLFAAHDLADYTAWADAIRAARPQTAIWVQTNSVAAALRLAAETRPDVLVVQGGEAGGHGGEASAGIISLVPETGDALAGAGFAGIPLIAAGGIADQRGVAAALALGAAGVTLGTRFLASVEAAMPNAGYQRAVLAAADGGQSTVKAKIFDDLNAKGNIWPKGYDGRGLRNASTRDWEGGVALEDIKKAFAEGAKVEGGYAAGSGSMVESRANAWAGTGVGLVREVKGAEEIVRECRDGALRILGKS